MGNAAGNGRSMQGCGVSGVDGVGAAAAHAMEGLSMAPSAEAGVDKAGVGGGLEGSLVQTRAGAAAGTDDDWGDFVG